MKLKYLLLKNCPLCGSSDIRDIIAKKIYLRNFGVEVSQIYATCSDCSFIFTKNPISKNDLEKYYSANTQERKAGVDEHELSHIKDQIDFLRHSLNFSNSSVLEIGANNGAFLSLYGAPDSYYSELNADSLAILKNKKNLKNFEKLPKEKRIGKFDQIMLFHTLEHIVEPRKFISVWAKYLKKDGVFFIEVPDFTFFDENTDDFIFEHVNFFSEKTLKRLFENSGLTVVASQIALDQNYPACTKYVVRMIAKKATSVLPTSTVSSRIAILKKREETREGYFKNIDSKLSKFGKKAPIAIYSASWLTIECLEKTKLLDYNIVSIFDRDPKKQGTTLKNIPIAPPDTILSKKIEHMFVLNEGYENEIKKYLHSIGFPVKKVSWWSDFK